MAPRKRKEEAREQKLLDEGQELAQLVKTQGWEVAKRKLIRNLAVLDSITSVPRNLPPDERMREMDVREGVISIIHEWLRDIEGTADASMASEQRTSEREESIIQLYEG